MTIDERLRELDKLEAYLKDHGIPYQRIDKPGYGEVDLNMIRYYGPFAQLERHQICVPCHGDECEWDAICHWGSYGADKGLLEIMGSIVRSDAGDTVEGYLTADDVIERIEEHENAGRNH